MFTIGLRENRYIHLLLEKMQRSLFGDF